MSGAPPPRTVLVLNGPNLNLLGRREPGLYGAQTLDDILDELVALGEQHGLRVEGFQSNHEGALIDRVQACLDDGTAGLLVNAGGLTHTSVALRDALLATALPFVEVHVTNVAAREPFRHTSLLTDAAVGVIAGLGPVGYSLALRGLLPHLPPHLQPAADPHPMEG